VGIKPSFAYFAREDIPSHTGRSQAFFLPAPGGNKFLLIEVAPFPLPITAGRIFYLVVDFRIQNPEIDVLETSETYYRC
jgi:hypothetical protein